MKRISVPLLILFALFLPVVGDGSGYAQPVAAQSMVGSSQECGTHEWHQDLIKGRTDGMLVRVHHTAGCFTYDYENLVGADREEMANTPERERAWQITECQRWGKEDTVNHFKWYRMMDINPDDVKVTCTPYKGPD